MKKFIIHSLKVQYFRGIKYASIDLRNKGVSVIIGNNESGKSSLLDAFLLLLEKKHDSAAQEIKDAITHGSDHAPKISAELTLGEQRLIMTKVYGKAAGVKGESKLHPLEPVGKDLFGGKANDVFTKLLKDNLDSQLRNALFVKQGESILSISGADISTLSDVLGKKQSHLSDNKEGKEPSTVVTVNHLGSVEAAQLLKTVEKEKLKYFSKSKKEQGDYAIATKNKENAEKDLSTLENEFSESESLIDDLNALYEKVRNYDREIPEIQQKVEGCEKEVTRAKEKNARRNQLVKDLGLVRIQLEQVEQRIQNRKEEKAELDQVLLSKKDAEEKVARVTRENDRIDQELGSIEAERKKVSLLLELARSKFSWLDVRKELHDVEEGAIRDEATIETVEKLQDQQFTLEREIQELRIDQKKLDRIDQAVNKVIKKVSILESLATSVRVELPDEEELFVDGVLQENPSEDFKVNSSSTFAFGHDQCFRVTVTPEKNAEVAQDELREAETELRELLDAVQVSDADEARQNHRLKLDKENQLKLVKQEIKGNLKDGNLDQLRAHVEDISKYKETLDERVRETRANYQHCSEKYISAYPRGGESATSGEEQTLVEKGIESLIVDSDVAVEDLKENLTQIQHQVEQFNDLREKLSQSFGELNGHQSREAYAVAKNELESIQRRYESAQARLAEKREKESDEALKQSEQIAKDAVVAAENELTIFEKDNKDVVDLETAQMSLESARTKLENKKNHRDKFRADFARIQGTLESRRGLPERVEEAKYKAEEADRVFQRLNREASAAMKLYQVFFDLQTELHKKYQAPFGQTFEALASLVFPEAHFTFDEKLQVKGRTKEGTELDISQLSQGTQEQIHLLARLTIASLTGEGAAVPIFIDDALGFSDSSRLDSMNLALKKLGETHQVIITTCEESRFDGIEGATIEFMQDILRKSDHEPA